MSCRLRLRVVPNARRNEIAGAHGEAIRIKIAAPALDGRANDALLDFLAESLRVSRRAVHLAQGPKSRDKIVEIDGVEENEARTRLVGIREVR